MATGEDRVVIKRLGKGSLRLDDKRVASRITVGIQTNADNIYHLKRLGKNRYLCSLSKTEIYETEIEDGLMKPLVSGKEAMRFEVPETDTYLLFPYARDEKEQVRLVTKAQLEKSFPKAWAYLLSHERALRARENKKMDVDEWYAYNYPKNLDKQDQPKLIVPRLVMNLCCTFDVGGNIWLDNVDAGGVLVSNDANPNFLMGVLNGQVANFVFRRTSKPFMNDYRSANKQFIAPLPVPRADAKTQAAIGARARQLQESWTNRRDLLKAANERLSTLPRAANKHRFLWPDLPNLSDLKAQAPKKLLNHEKTDWAHARLEEHEAQKIEALQGFLNGGGELQSSFANGELRLTCGGAVVLGKIYMDDADGKLAEVYWRYLILSRPKDAKSFASSLARIPASPELAAARQFIERVNDLLRETEAIRAQEREMNNALYVLYNLTEDERLLIEKDCAARALI